MLLDYLDKSGLQHTRGTRESIPCWNSMNSGRAPTPNRSRAWKTLSNLRGLRLSFRARDTPRTPDKLGSPPPSVPRLTLYSTRTKLGSTMEAKLTLSVGRSRGVFIGGLSRCFGRKLARGPTCQAGRPVIYGGRVVKFCGRTDFPTSDPLLTDLT
jgi:hypothetical protein